MKAPRGAKLIPLTQGQFAIVDAEDYERLMRWKWQAEFKGGVWRAHRIFTENGRRFIVAMHQAVFGKAPIGLTIDHRNRNALDNRKRNLRYATQSEQLMNAAVRNRWGLRGVRQRPCGTFYSNIRYLGRRIYLGTFKTPDAAAIAYAQAALKFHGEFACLEVKRAAA